MQYGISLAFKSSAMQIRLVANEYIQQKGMLLANKIDEVGI